eukprot:6186476-Pleurochrysis_carterae.AAC.1
MLGTVRECACARACDALCLARSAALPCRHPVARAISHTRSAPERNGSRSEASANPLPLSHPPPPTSLPCPYRKPPSTETRVDADSTKLVPALPHASCAAMAAQKTTHEPKKAPAVPIPPKT